jgi:hypothetical protein
MPKHWLLVVLYLRWAAELWPAEVTSADRIRQAMGTGAP